MISWRDTAWRLNPCPTPSHYTAPAYLAELPGLLATARREDVILYNPLKGAPVTARLMAAFPQWTFRPLRGLDRTQLAQAFLGAKLYIDFGHHPGKDRLPREAALHGCCVITARQGSAANAVDLPIPQECKFDVRAPDFVQRFGARVSDLFEHFEAHSRELEGYRATIAQEPLRWREQVQAAFLSAAP
ncbi:hypothetical protein [Ramlibacter aquaticus]|uniref:hypothetical protein n=1 Tax=Ramlibacter aquaticus TaxID=2780094 RepID=UPI001D0F92D4|nr:hypothetical protein [Ramlibacter aquaticus]